MSELRFTLLSDGSSDRALLHVLRWLLLENGVLRPIHGEPADLGRFRRAPRRLAGKIELSLQWYPCELLFVHRDAESVGLQDRKAEIERAVSAACCSLRLPPPTVCVVPVRMTEAWFLFNEQAIRQAAGNPNGRDSLVVPAMGRVEGLPEPKRLLHDLFREASGLQGRRRHAFDAHGALHRLAEIIEDYSPLRALPAFQSLEADVRVLIGQHNWHALS